MTRKTNKTIILAGDIGGTKTNLGIFTQGKNRPILQAMETYSSQSSSNLEDIIQQFLKSHPVNIRSACFGVAGPVINGRCKVTNLPWDIAESRIKKQFHWPHIRLINDLAATAMAIPFMTHKEFVSLNKARAQKDQNLALIAPGTGLGQALLVVDDGHYTPISSEGGHVDFAPTNEEQIELWRHLHRKWGHVSIERVASGMGLASIYSWIKHKKQYREPLYLRRMFREMDPAKAVTQAAMKDNNPLCSKALDMFISILGAVAGNLALTGMTRGGVYLGGGIPPKILPRLKQGRFMKAFADKGRFQSFLEKIPVKVIMNDKAALVGAAHYAFLLYPVFNLDMNEKSP
jgi:glucokinase